MFRDFMNQEWELTESDASVRRMSERLFQGAEVATKGYLAADMAAERRRQLKRATTRAHVEEFALLTGIVGTLATFITGRRG